MARRIAEERGWTIGREIGWHIRFERQFTADTRLLVVTEGILTAYLQQDPLLSDVATIVIDEFHERSVHADLGLALAKQAWLARSDLRIVVMSATLDPQPVSAFLGDCPIIRRARVSASSGDRVRARRVDRDGVGRGAAAHHAATCCASCLERGRSILRSARARKSRAATMRSWSRSTDRSMRPRRIAPCRLLQAKRRIIVATNIAETSLTVSGVSAVIDSGLQKVASYDADRGVDALTTERITLDSADQRAGRAARLGPGLVRRLWDARDRLRPHREAEIHRVDLSPLVLSILAAGGRLQDFEWFDRPSPDRISAALGLLTQLGAVKTGRITHVGEKMLHVALPPRIARIFLEGFGAVEVCRACAWLAEPTSPFAKPSTSAKATADKPEDRRLTAVPATTSDLLTVLDRWRDMPANLHEVSERLERIAAAALGTKRVISATEVKLRRALLTGYPDRVARRRSGDKVTLASGHGAVMGKESGVHDAEWLIAIDVAAGRTGDRTEAIIRVASRIEREWLAPTRSTIEEKINESGSATAREIDWYGELILTERSLGMNVDMTAAVLGAAWMERGPDKTTARLLRRVKFAGLGIEIADFVFAAAANASRVQDIVITEDVLSWEIRQQLARNAPATLTVPSGRAIAIDYANDGSVSVSVKLQELFGLAETPRLGLSKTPITFHLLAPNGRPVQTTQDLKSFWERTYPEVRKELRGRYPKHPWPEDPWRATPTHRSIKGAARAAGSRPRRDD